MKGRVVSCHDVILGNQGWHEFFYRLDNSVLANFIEGSKTLFEEMLERNDHAVSSIKIQNLNKLS